MQQSESSPIDPSLHVLRNPYKDLNNFFSPSSVAVIGASETTGSVGRSLLWNLISSPFGGVVYPVNQKRSSVLGIKAYPSIAAVPDKVDLAVIATAAPTVPGLVEECLASGVRTAVIISAGFKEAGSDGIELERRIIETARRGRMRLIGPNCLGVMCPNTGLNATFASRMARPGNVAFISQSGALCTAILDWSIEEMVGFSAFISLGSMLDVGWGDLIDYLGNDPATKSILIYMESIGDARAFLSAAREVALTKPIIVIKAGKTEAAAKAAASHTGALTGSDEVLDAAFRRCGVLRVNNISDLFYMAEVLARQPRPKGSRLTILTNAGGPGVLATDALITGHGKLAELSSETMESLNSILPAHWSHSNPIDILGDAGPVRYAKAVEIAAKDPNSDGLLVILTPQQMTEPTETAAQLKPFAQLGTKPILASWMGGADIAAGEKTLNLAGIPTFPYPDTAVRVFNYMWRYAYNLRGLYETPILSIDGGVSKDTAVKASQIIESARASGRTLLTEYESKSILEAYDIPTVPTRKAENIEDAVRFAEEFGFPVVLKLHSETITHKTDVGGVKLNLENARAIEEAFEDIRKSVSERADVTQFLGVTVQPMIRMEGYELILGSSIDPQFGPVLLFGAGGQLVEVFQDRALALPPINSTLARRLMEQTRIFTALQGVRGRKPVDIAALEQLIVRFSHIVVEQPWISEIDINPLMASAEGLLALDARIVLHSTVIQKEDLPRLAIRPYPIQYLEKWVTNHNLPVTIRPIRPEDEPMMIHFHEALSERSIHMRYFQAMKLSQRVSHERLTRICFIDYDREIVQVAEYEDPNSHAVEIVAVGRLSRLPGTKNAEFALLVSDAFQGHGLGMKILQQLLQIGRAEGLRQIHADILMENSVMQHLCEKLGFSMQYSDEEEVMKAEIDL